MRRGAATIAGLVVGVTSANAQHLGDPWAIAEELGYMPGQILVCFDQDLDLPGKDQVLAGTHSRLIEEFKSIPDVAVVSTIPGLTMEESIELLRLSPGILDASPNYVGHGSGREVIPNDTLFNRQWGLHNTGRNLDGVAGIIGNAIGTIDADVDMPQAWVHATDCSDIVVAVVDTGTDITHADWGGLATAGGNIFVNPGDATANGTDNDSNGVVDDINGACVSAHPLFNDASGNGLFETTEWIIQDSDSSNTVSVGDLRLGAGPGGAAGTSVGAGDPEIGMAVRRFFSQTIPLFERYVDADASATYTNGEAVVLDLNANGTFEAATDFVIAGAAPANGTALVNFAELHAENVTSNFGYNAGEWIVLDADASNTISVGDTRRTATAGGAAGTVVAAGNADIGTALVPFWNNTVVRERHADPNANSVYDAGEWIVDDIDGGGTISAGDWRKTATAGGAAGTIVRAGNADIGTALRDFTAATTNDITDIGGHGTLVASVIGAQGNNNRAIAGVCWKVQILTVKHAVPQSPPPASPPNAGSFLYSDTIRAFDYIIELKQRTRTTPPGQNPVNIRVVNLSGGGDGYSVPLRAACGRLNAAGILLVAAAGNDGANNDGDSGPENLYRDVDGDNQVSIGDVRLTPRRNFTGGVPSFFPAGSVVAAGDADITFPLSAHNANERYDDANGNLSYDGGEFVYRSTGAAVAPGDTRISAVRQGGTFYAPGSTVAVGDADIGRALRNFAANEKHTGIAPANGMLNTFYSAEYPASFDLPNIISVAASDNRDRMTAFSAWGTTSVDCAAPGQDIIMLQRAADGGGTLIGSGTSYATPCVAGICAHAAKLFPALGHLAIRSKVLDIDEIDSRFGVRNAVLAGNANDARARALQGDDVGDAPDAPFPTLRASSGARHEDIGEEWLGRDRDIICAGAPPAGLSDASPEFDATDAGTIPPDPDGIDNLVGPDDADKHDDGIDLVGPFLFSPAGGPPVFATVDVWIDTAHNAISDADSGRYPPFNSSIDDHTVAGPHPAPGVHAPTDNKYLWVNAWFDWNRDGDWLDANEHVFQVCANPNAWLPGSGGMYRVVFEMPPAPATVQDGALWARFRLDHGENAGQVFMDPPVFLGPCPGGKARFWNSTPPLPLPPAAPGHRYDQATHPGSLLVGTKGLAQFGEVEDYVVSRGAGFEDQLHVDGPIPNDIVAGAGGTITIALESNFVGVPNVPVACLVEQGAIALVSGSPAPDGQSTQLITDANGRAQLDFDAIGPGPALVSASVGGLSAFSFFLVQANPLAADVNDDGVIDVRDIAFVIFRLGTADPEADLDADGTVTVSDLGFVIFRLGQEP